MRDVLVYGDPHGEWEPLLRACRDDPPEGVLILGDCDLDVPLRRKLSFLFDAGIKVRWIPGNHDKDDEGRHDNLFLDHPVGNLHATWCRLGGLIFAGLGGIFKERVWAPRFDEGSPSFATRREFLRGLPASHRWRGGLPLRMRDCIFPEDVSALSMLRADVLISHEAPSSHPYGFVGVDMAARACRARLIVHGHHHESRVARLGDGTRVRGLGRAEAFRISHVDLD